MPFVFFEKINEKLFGATEVGSSTTLKARLLIEKEGKYLCLRQTAERGGYLTFPGGVIKNKERIKKGLVREVKEETNLHFKKSELQLIHFQHRAKSKQKQVVFYFKATLDDASDLTLTEPEKFSNFQWVSTDDIALEFAPGSKSAFKKIVKGKMFSEWRKKKNKTIKNTDMTFAKDLDNLVPVLRKLN